MSGLVRKLRPAKIRSAVRRRVFERRLARLPIEPGPPVVHLGTAYGGWIIPEGAVTKGQICYSVGAGADISFDLELIRRYGAIVRAVDPVEEYAAAALEAAAGDSRFSFRRAAVSVHDGSIRMQRHHEPGNRSLSAGGLYDARDWVEADGRTIHSLMREFGDDHIDLLKLDVEGIEYDLVPTLDLVALGTRVFAVELHHTGSFAQASELIEGLSRQGFRLVARKPPGQVTFARESSSRGPDDLGPCVR
jgi:FkbM family methyltransferase